MGRIQKGASRTRFGNQDVEKRIHQPPGEEKAGRRRRSIPKGSQVEEPPGLFLAAPGPGVMDSKIKERGFGVTTRKSCLTVGAICQWNRPPWRELGVGWGLPFPGDGMLSGVDFLQWQGAGLDDPP